MTKPNQLYLSVIAIVGISLFLIRSSCNKSANESFTNPNGYYTISWSPPSSGILPLTNYEYGVCQGLTCDPSSDPTFVPLTSVQDLSFNFSEGEWNETYTISVRAVNINGNGPWSSTTLTTGIIPQMVIGESANVDNGTPVATQISSGTPNLQVAAITSSVVPSGYNANVSLSRTTSGGTSTSLGNTSMTITSSSTNSSLVSDLLTLPSGVILNGGDTITGIVIITDPSGVLYSSSTKSVNLELPGYVGSLNIAFIPLVQIPFPTNFYITDSSGNCPQYNTSSSTFVQTQTTSNCTIFNSTLSGNSSTIGANSMIFVTNNDSTLLYLSNGDGGIPIDNVLLVPVSGGYTIQVLTTPATYISWINQSNEPTVLGLSSQTLATTWSIVVS